MKTAFKILMFFAIGELVFQAHKHYGVAEVPDVSDEKVVVARGTFTNTIFLLGDSYTKGLGIPENERIASNIAAPGYRVKDLSHSSDNWADYIDKVMAAAVDIRAGDIIVICVNWNDVAFRNGSVNYILAQPTGKNDTDTIKQKLLKNTGTRGMRKLVHFFYRNSTMISFLSTNIQNTLKRNGLPLPIGDFHYYKEVAYSEQREELDNAINFIGKVCEERSVSAILYLMPDFNLAQKTGYFRQFTDYFAKYDGSRGITVVNGVMYFHDAEDGYYCISIHDGHPNGKAHMRIAEQINAIINRQKKS